MRKFQHLRSQKGMTLVEVIMTVLIVAIIAAISIPMWTSYMPTMRLNGAAQNLQLALALTRMKAVARNQSMSLLFTDQYNYSLQKWNGVAWVEDVDPDRARGDKLMAPTDLQTQGISITATAFGNRIIFDSRGSCRNAASGGALVTGDITLSGHGKSRTITITGSTGIAKLN